MNPANPSSRDMEPSVGCIVWYWPGCDEPGQPQAAIINYVHNSKMVNLTVFTHAGFVQFRSSVRLCQPSDTESVLSEHARWMPYQQAQHDKAAEEKTPSDVMQQYLDETPAVKAPAHKAPFTFHQGKPLIPPPPPPTDNTPAK